MPVGPAQGYQAISNVYTGGAAYGGDPGTYGLPATPSYTSPLPMQGLQGNAMLSIYMSMMDSQSQLQQGFSQYLGVSQSLGFQLSAFLPQQPSYGAGYQQPAPSYGAPSYGAPSYAAPSYGGGGGYAPAPAPVRQAPAPAPAPPAKKGGYS
jgi:hypothetical protein